MPEILSPTKDPQHFAEIRHKNGETILCIPEGEDCRVTVEIADGYSPEEYQQFIMYASSTLEAVDAFIGGRLTDVFAGLNIKIGEDITESGGQALTEENTILLSGRKMLLSINQMRLASGAYTDDELVDFPDTNRAGGAMQYTLAHEMAHLLDWQTKAGSQYHRIDAAQSPTVYGRVLDQRHPDNKDHEAFAEGFAHAVWGMAISTEMQSAIHQTLDARLAEIATKKNRLSVQPIMHENCSGQKKFIL